MAVTGVILVAFLVLHMAGNLKIFFGAQTFDAYAHWLREIGEPMLPYSAFLWIQRVVLTAAVVGHIWSAAALAHRAGKARPVKYAHRPKIEGSYAARTMRWGGVIIFLFVVYHILDLTTRHLNPVSDSGQAYEAVAQNFAPERFYVTAFYAVAVIALAFHLRHGVWSALQTLGVNNARRERTFRAIATTVAVALCVGFLAVPFAVTVGLVG